VRQNPLNVIGLLDLDADADRVDRRFNQHLFIFIAGNVNWIQHNFRRCSVTSTIEQSGRLCGIGEGSGYFASISGMLCRSTTWEEKFSRQSAAVSEARTQLKYGRSVFACNER
jgi:hypothetical protein